MNTLNNTFIKILVISLLTTIIYSQQSSISKYVQDNEMLLKESIIKGEITKEQVIIEVEQGNIAPQILYELNSITKPDLFNESEIRNIEEKVTKHLW